MGGGAPRSFSHVYSDREKTVRSFQSFFIFSYSTLIFYAGRIWISIATHTSLQLAPPGVFGSLGERTFIFRELESTSIYCQGAGEPALNFGELGSIVRMRFSNLLFFPLLLVCMCVCVRRGGGGGRGSAPHFIHTNLTGQFNSFFANNDF